MNKIKKNNIVSFPTKLTDVEREIEAIVFAAAEPLSVETIESKLSKQTDIQQSLEKLKDFYSNRGINLICISNKWSFRTAVNLSSLMSEQKTVEKKLSRAAVEKQSVIEKIEKEKDSDTPKIPESDIHTTDKRNMPKQQATEYLEKLMKEYRERKINRLDD